MKNLLSLEKRVSKLEKLLTESSEDDDLNPHSPKFIESAQRLFDLMEEIEARLETAPSEFETLHMNSMKLDALRDMVEEIKNDANEWLSY